MSGMRIAVIGAGSHVFGPTVLHGAIVEHRLDGAEIALIDLNRETVDLMAAIGRRVARESGVNLTITAHTDRRAGIAGADFVICSAARDLQRRFAMDVAIVHQYAPGHLVTEFGGVQGISYSLRQIALIEEIVADMKELAPTAWLLNSANPLPRLCQAAHELGVPTAGFCSNSMGGYHLIGKLMLDVDEWHPWTMARDRYEAVMAGVNHFTWLLQLIDRRTGADVTAEFRDRVRSELGDSYTGLLFDETGCWPPNGDGHMRDFLPPNPHSEPMTEASHGTPNEREQRLMILRDIAAGNRDWQPLLAHRAWEKPIDFVAGNSEFHSLNLINCSQIPNLPLNAFVETPARGREPRTLTLPPAVAKHCRATAELTDVIVRAARQRNRALVHLAAKLDPTILNKQAGIQALDECLRAHADILPVYQ